MILGDTIVKIDTVYIEKVNDYLTQGEVIDLFDKVHSFHNDEYSDFLVEISVLLVVLGFIAVFISHRRIAAAEERLNRDNERNETRLNREIEHIRNENRRFQDSIDERIEERINRRVEDFDLIMVKKIEEFDKKYMKTLENMNSHIFCHLNITQAILFYDKAQYKDSINIYLRAVFNAINVTNEEYINIIKFNIENNSRLYSTVQKSEINPEDELTLEMYFKKLESNIGNNESLRNVYNNFKKTLLAILGD
ncbi:MAG: hypothetical protein R2863_02280 [Candidatus Kapaibacterium sp.]